MEEHLLNDCVLAITLTDAKGEKIASIDMPYKEIDEFRKKNSAPASALLESVLTNLVNIALYGPNGISDAKNLPPRKPGGDEFNR